MLKYPICKNNLPHQLKIIQEFEDVQYEQCIICGFKCRWNKDSKGRVNNLKYLELHIGDTCQPTGPTKAIYHKVYHPQYNYARICLNCQEVCFHKTGARTTLRIDNRVKPKPGMTMWDA